MIEVKLAMYPESFSAWELGKEQVVQIKRGTNGSSTWVTESDHCSRSSSGKSSVEPKDMDHYGL